MTLRMAAVLVLVASGCEQWENGAEVVLHTAPAPEAASAPAATVESGHGLVRVQGVIAVPDRCHHLEADITQNESDVRLWVMYDQVEETCPPEPFKLAYTAEIQGLSPGRYNLRVVHGRSGRWRGTEPILVHPIVVPSS